MIVKRGFEYLIQDAMPAPEATGIEIFEENAGGFPSGEYHLDVGELYLTWTEEEQYEHNTIWWFRAFYEDEGENVYKAGSWMKNVPIISTSECSGIQAQEVTGNGDLTDKGASIVTRLGFRIIKEYSGDLEGAWYYCNVLSGYKVAEGLEEHTIYDSDGIFIIGYYWTGIFYRDAFFPKSQTPGNFDLGIYSYPLGGGFLGEEFGIYLKPNDTYKIQAIAKNELGVGYADEIVDVTTGQNFIYEEDDPIVSPTSVEKTVEIRDIPDGVIVTRVGIRLGRTPACNEIDVFMDGEWGNGDSITFFITDLVPGYYYYEEPYMILKDGDNEEEIIGEEEEEFWVEELEDEDLDYIIPGYETISYKTVIREIICENTSDQSFIDKAGRKRSKTISNHLIQDRETCQEIIIDYLEKFQTIKLKAVLDYDIPMPFEREDVILIDEGRHKFKADGEGEIPFKADGEGEILMRNALLVKIRKIDSRFISGSETILSLELEV